MSWRSKLSHVFQELRIHLCQTSPSSTATREFITRNYVDLKALNPTLPLLIRECSGVQPCLWARYDYGVERSVPLDGLAAHEIDVKLEELVNLGIPERFQDCLWHQRGDIFIFVSTFSYSSKPYLLSSRV
ncbi:unnamed protein product [Sphagnum jensenii]|uniref:Ribosomal protein/NADH dehydrogenase domain-containing protein n=1 Tax=Sphagnum jensenii TaxID=128206 RepID=A0ABP1BYT6_9BRYO